MIYIAPDTNIFLHFKAFDQLSWDVIATGLRTIIVAPTVLEELDKKKWDSDRKLNSRARSALKLIDEAETGGDRYKGLPLIVIPRPAASAYQVQGLSYDSADHRIIGELLDFGRSIQAADELILVTADSTMRRQATTFGLRVTSPPESDELPAEEDPRDSKIRRLTAQVLRFEGALPKIRPFVSNETGSGKAIRFSETIEPELSKAAVDDRLARVEDHHARQKPGDGTTSDQWKKYENEWAAFLREYRVYCVEEWRHRNRTFSFSIGITNDGPVPGRGIDLFVHFPDGFDLIRSKKYKAPEVPMRPRKPMGPYEELAGLLENFKDGGPFGYPVFRSYAPPPLDIPTIRIRKTNSYDVELPARELKQTLTHRWETLVLRYDDNCLPTSFPIDYRLVVANSHGVEEGQLKIKFGPPQERRTK